MIDAFLQTHSDRSRRAVRAALDRLAAVLGFETIDVANWPTMKASDVAAATRQLTEHWSPATAQQAVSVLRSWLRYLGGELPALDPQLRLLERAIVRPRGTRLGSGRALDAGEVVALFDAAAASPNPTRDSALLALAYGAGLRRAEIAELAWSAFDGERGQAVRVVGKGNRERTVPLPWGAINALEDHAAATIFETKLERSSDAFQRRTIVGLTSDGIRYAVVQLAIDARLAHVSPHDLRRSYVTDLLERTGDLAAVQRLAGHASPNTTTLYNRGAARAAERAAGALLVPYRPTAMQFKVPLAAPPIPPASDPPEE